MMRHVWPASGERCLYEPSGASAHGSPDKAEPGALALQGEDSEGRLRRIASSLPDASRHATTPRPATVSQRRQGDLIVHKAPSPQVNVSGTPWRNGSSNRRGPLFSRSSRSERQLRIVSRVRLPLENKGSRARSRARKCALSLRNKGASRGGTPRGGLFSLANRTATGGIPPRCFSSKKY